MMNEKSSISQATTLEEMGEFWDTHDFTEFDTDAPDVSFTIAHSVVIDPSNPPIEIGAVEPSADRLP